MRSLQIKKKVIQTGHTGYTHHTQLPSIQKSHMGEDENENEPGTVGEGTGRNEKKIREYENGRFNENKPQKKKPTKKNTPL